MNTNLFYGKNQALSSYVLNPYDLYMVERLTDLKKTIQCKIVAITMGPMGCLDHIKRMKAIGIDEIYLISDPCFAGSDTYSSSYILSKALEHIGKFDIYAFGEKSLDGETGQVPIGVSTNIGLFCHVKIESIKICDNSKIMMRKVKSDRVDIIEGKFPLAISFSGFSTTDIPISLLQLKQINRYQPIVLDKASMQIDERQCGQSGSKTKASIITNTIKKRKSILIDGDSANKIQTFNSLMESGGIQN
nr:hypothetical protein [uncultured Lachnoclostridium sp.]